MKKKVVACFMATAMVLGLTACGSGSTTSTTAEAPAASAESTPETGASEAETDKGTSAGLKIGLAVQTLSNQVWAQQAERIQQDAEADGNEVTCYIFNRWGEKMAEFHDPAQGWDGRYKGKIVPAGVYYYVIKARGSDGKDYNLSGDINILNYK